MGYDLKFEQDGAFSGTSKAWLKNRKGLDTCRPITLDLSTFTGATHYPNGFIPSGMGLAIRTADNRGVAIGTASSVPAGHLLDDCKVRAGNETGAAVVALFWEGIVDTTKLPANHGVTNAMSILEGALADFIRYEPPVPV
jgi:hypothetical protein